MGADKSFHPGELHNCMECKLVNTMDAIREAGEDQLVILNAVISKWKGKHYEEAARAALQRARILELRKPSTVAEPPVEVHPLADPATGKLGLNATPWTITNAAKHWADCNEHKRRMNQRKGVNDKGKAWCRYDCPSPGCANGAWHSEIFGDE